MSNMRLKRTMHTKQNRENGQTPLTAGRIRLYAGDKPVKSFPARHKNQTTPYGTVICKIKEIQI